MNLQGALDTVGKFPAAYEQDEPANQIITAAARAVTETAEEWLCIERQHDETLHITNMPGNERWCYFLGERRHLPDCGPRRLVEWEDTE